MKKGNKNIATTDEELLWRSANGDRQAFEHLYDRYRDKLVWFARGFLQDGEKAEDVVQDVFIKLIERPKRFDASKRFSTWIFTITANQCRNQLRNESNRSRILSQLGSEDVSVESESPYDRKTVLRKLGEAVSRLNEKEKRIYFLRFEQEAPVKDIAIVLEMPEGTVKSAIFYLIKKIAAQLKDYHDENR